MGWLGDFTGTKEFALDLVYKTLASLVRRRLQGGYYRQTK